MWRGVSGWGWTGSESQIWDFRFKISNPKSRFPLTRRPGVGPAGLLPAADLPEFLQELPRPAAALVRRPRRFAEVALALDVAVLQTVRPPADLPRHRFAARDERLDLKFQI